MITANLIPRFGAEFFLTDIVFYNILKISYSIYEFGSEKNENRQNE